MKPNWNNIKYFKKSDFPCKCNRHNESNPALPEYAELNYYYICRYFLDPLRKDCKSAIILTSGSRCIPHNKEEGGASNSQHIIDSNERGIKPDAVDMYCPKLSYQEFDKKIQNNVNVEYCGYKIYLRQNNDGSIFYLVHIDFRGIKARW